MRGNSFVLHLPYLQQQRAGVNSSSTGGVVTDFFCFSLVLFSRLSPTFSVFSCSLYKKQVVLYLVQGMCVSMNECVLFCALVRVELGLSLSGDWRSKKKLNFE